MDLNLTKNIYNMHIKGFQGLNFNIIYNNNYEIAYNEYIRDSYSNFISNFDVNNKEEFNTIMNEVDKTFRNMNRKTTVYLIPHMKELYKNKEKYFDNDKFELASTEVWQTYTDFDELDKIKFRFYIFMYLFVIHITLSIAIV